MLSGQQVQEACPRAPYNLYLMSTNQRSRELLPRNSLLPRTQLRELPFHTPQINRRLPSARTPRKQASSSRFKHQQQLPETTQSALVQRPQLHHKWTSPESHPQTAFQKGLRGKEEDLRETDDSVRPQRCKRLSISCFEVIRLLGKGKHGTVFLAMHKETGFVGALKVFSKEQLRPTCKTERDKLQEELIRELKIQSFVDHAHIIRLYAVFADKEHVYAFMEAGSDGQLYEVLQRRRQLREETISFVSRSLLEALHYLHAKGVIHRDIKPENIVLIHGFPKICDFGESNCFSRERGELRETLCGTPLYLSPEILLGGKYDEKIDVWALGAMGYELFTGENPFNIRNKEELRRIVTEEFRMSSGSAELCSFLTHCLKKSPLERPSSGKLLKHPLISKWRELETAEELCQQLPA